MQVGPDAGGAAIGLNPTGPREGDATAVEARANFMELGWTELDWSAGAWWRQVDAGYSISRFDMGMDVEEYGAEVLGQFTPNLGVFARYSNAERGSEVLRQAQASLEWRLGEYNALTAEVRRVEEQRQSQARVAGTLGAVKYSHRVGTALDLYGIGQVTLDDDGGQYEDNNALTLGSQYNFAGLRSAVQPQRPQRLDAGAALEALQPGQHVQREPVPEDPR